MVAGGYLLALLSLGIIIGSTWPELFRGWIPFLFLLFLISGGYVTYVWLKQERVKYITSSKSK
jgi:hypothetical protein